MRINLYCRLEILFTIVLINFRPRAQCFTLSVRPINDVEVEFPLETNDETNDRAHRRYVEALYEKASSLDLVEDNLIYPSCFHVFVHLSGGGCNLYHMLLPRRCPSNPFKIWRHSHCPYKVRQYLL